MISTHILDTSLGSPAAGVTVRLDKLSAAGSDQWQQLFEEKTNSDGRIAFNCEYVAGTYRLTFLVEDYHKRAARSSFFSNVPVVFHIEDVARKYHVPLLLNPFGYSTYRGS